MKNLNDEVNRTKQLMGLSENTESSTMDKLIKTAERDGHLTGHEPSAGYVLTAAHKIADEWDELSDAERNVYRDAYYQKFLKAINKV